MKNRISSTMIFLLKNLTLISLLALSIPCLAQTSMVSLDNKPAQVAEEVCYKIHLLNFDQEGVGDYEITWNNKIAQLNSALANGDFFYEQEVLDKSKQSKLSFAISEDIIKDINKGTVNPQICFHSLKEGFTPIEIRKVGTTKKSNLTAGGLSISKTPFAGEMLIASNEITNSGDQACVSISVEGFNTVQRLTFGLSAGVTIATFDEGANFNLPGLSAANIMDNGAFGQVLIWDAPNQNTGVTVPDGTVILDFCFDVNGAGGQSTDVTFPTILEFSIFFGIDGNQTVPMTQTGSITIPDVPPLEIAGDFISADNCFGVDNGEVQITPNGGVPPYTFSWSNMTTDQDLTGVPSGNYSVTISDSGVPVNELIMNYTVPSDMTPPTVDAGSTQAITCDNPQVTLGSNNTSNGTEFEYQWLGPAGVAFISGQNDIMAVVDEPGMYSLRVINTLNGCDAEATVLIEADTMSPNLILPMDQALTCQEGGLVLSALNDQMLPNLNALWDTEDGIIDNIEDDLSVNVSAAGTYSAILTNADNGCTSSGSVLVSQPILPTISLDGEVSDLNCDAATADLSVIIDPAHSVMWTTVAGAIDSGADTPMAIVSAAGTYIAEVTDPTTQCTNTLDIMVEGDTSEPTVMAGEDMTISCTTPIVTLTGIADEANAIAWTDAQGNFSGNELTLEVNRPGIYTLNVTNAFGCMRSDEVLVEADTMMPIANAGLDMEVACIGADITLDGSASSMGAEFEYMWTTANGILISGFNTLTPTISTAGTYDLLVTNTRNGCTSTDIVVLSLQGGLPTADAGDDFSSCEATAVLVGNIEAGVTGMWTTTSSAIIDDPSAAQISIANLNPGANEFMWSLSTDDCADFSISTVTINLESTPNAIDDTFSIPLDSTMISENVITNDNVANNAGGLTIDYSPLDPNFIDLENGSFNYTFPNDSILTTSFTYLICSEVCPTLCDSATITLVRELPPLEPVDLDALPNAITPNGDGINDALIFDLLITNPLDFPNSELVIFNRWGDVVFKQQPYDNTWQGTNQSGNELPEGTYYFVNRLSLENPEILSGDITIIRD